MKKARVLGILALALLVTAGCAAGPNQMANTPDQEGGVAGFWQGLWHAITI